MGRGRLRFSTATCWRRAKTSTDTSARLRKNTRNAAMNANRTSSTNDRCNTALTSLFHWKPNCGFYWRTEYWLRTPIIRTNMNSFRDSSACRDACLAELPVWTPVFPIEDTSSLLP